MYNNVFNFMNEKELIYKYQFVFFIRNTQHNKQLISLVDKITKSLDSGDIVIGVFLDLKKAFDTANHKIIFKNVCIWYPWQHTKMVW